MNRYTHTKRGFTLIEFVIYMGILSILLIVFIDMFALLVNRQLETESLSAVQQDSNYLLSRFSYDFGNAQSIQFPTGAGSSSATLLLNIGTTSVDFFASSSALFSSSSGTLNQLNSNETSITNLVFQRLGEGNSNDVIKISCDISSKVKKQSGYEVIHFSSTFGTQ